MAIVHPTTLKPTKPEILTELFDSPVEIVGTYRYDDPAGEVGVEGLMITVGAELRHVVMTYRGAPLDGAEQHLLSTMEHGVLGQRWVYDGLGDPVAIACFERALAGEKQQATLDVYAGDTLVEVREPTARVALIDGDRSGQRGLAIAGELAHPLTADGAHLLVTWDGGHAVVAALV